MNNAINAIAHNAIKVLGLGALAAVLGGIFSLIFNSPKSVTYWYEIVQGTNVYTVSKFNIIEGNVLGDLNGGQINVVLTPSAGAIEIRRFSIPVQNK